MRSEGRRTTQAAVGVLQAKDVVGDDSRGCDNLKTGPADIHPGADLHRSFSIGKEESRMAEVYVLELPLIKKRKTVGESEQI